MQLTPNPRLVVRNGMLYKMNIICLFFVLGSLNDDIQVLKLYNTKQHKDLA
jgi:hypothetical protein